MSCSTKITADIVECTKLPTKGLKYKAWIFNNGDVTFTKEDNKATALTVASGASSFTIEGSKDFIKAGHEAVIAENIITKYKHTFSAELFPLTSAEKANIDIADNIIVVVETNGVKGEGSFLVYGETNGLWKASQTQSSADNNGLTTIEFASREGMEERHSSLVLQITDYDATKTALIASETPA